MHGWALPWCRWLALLRLSPPTCPVLAAVGSKDALHPYIAFHAALRTAHQAFVSRLEETARQLLRTHLEAATSAFSMSMCVGRSVTGLLGQLSVLCSHTLS
jgi:hypothetical protein